MATNKATPDRTVEVHRPPFTVQSGGAERTRKLPIPTNNATSPDRTAVSNCCGPLMPATVQGQAIDIIVYEGTGATTTNDFVVHFDARPGLVKVQFNGIFVEELAMIASDKGCRFVEGFSQKPGPVGMAKLVELLDHTQSNCKSESNQLCFHLMADATANPERIALGKVDARLFRWNAVNDKIVVCDIDGTITKSNVRGVVDTVLTDNYSYIHDGVCQFLHSLLKDTSTALTSKGSGSCRVLYLTSRPLLLAATTRNFLTDMEQEGLRLPVGPLLCNTQQELSSVLWSELVLKNIHLTKRDTLLQHVVLPSAAAIGGAASTAGKSSLLVAGIGNTGTDTQAYDLIGIPLQHIYQIDKSGHVRCFDDAVFADKPGERDYDKLLKESTAFEQGYQDPELLTNMVGKVTSPTGNSQQ